MKLLLSPHNDDECLFAAYTLMREKPLVVIVTDSNMQLDTHGVSAQDRREESRRGCEVLDVPVVFLGLTDQEVLDEADLRQRLEPFMGQDWNRVYAPAVQHGHDHHDLVGKVASARFPRVSYYSTYTKENYTPVGEIAIVPTEVEIALKNKALDCYATQIRINGVHFDAVRGKPEFMNRSPHSWESHAGGIASRLPPLPTCYD